MGRSTGGDLAADPRLGSARLGHHGTEGSGICIASPVLQGAEQGGPGNLCNLIPTLELIMSTEEGEARGGTATTHRHTWEEEPRAPRERPHPGDEDQAEPGEEREERDGGVDRREDRGCGDTFGGDPQESNRGDFSSEDGAVGGAACKTQGMHSSCSSETCIPTPSCRICFQGAEQVSGPPACGPVRLHVVGRGGAPGPGSGPGSAQLSSRAVPAMSRRLWRGKIN